LNSHSPPPSHLPSHSPSPDEHILPLNSQRLSESDSHSHSQPASPSLLDSHHSPDTIILRSNSEVDPKGPKRHVHGPSIQIHSEHSSVQENGPSPISPSLVHPQDLHTPITPNYQFGRDDNFKTHHDSDHVPNLHDHSHIPDRLHEGHSHNMRGVFLHVMAVSVQSCLVPPNVLRSP